MLVNIHFQKYNRYKFMGSYLLRLYFWKCMLTSIRNVKVIKCMFLICLSPLFVLYFYDPRNFKTDNAEPVHSEHESVKSLI